MFKIESYVTPILLSYVDKYVRDFKPADAQVSLWGGGVALHNLVLKADVLQKEIALPFTLVSGRIHELLIQVPWTKIMSEPIVVTIDTIECVLSIHPPAPDDNVPPESPSRKVAAVEAPPGYMQALVRRVVSNITLRVHHLIVKYVQDDVVLSLNIKHLSVESAGSNWETSFADIDQAEPLIRRLVRLDDLTLCLDRADADGKIRFYQEPLLYRCQLDLRVMTRLMSANTRRATSLCVQLRSSKLAWGVTSEQLTLLLRLLRERSAEHAAPPPPPAKPQAPNSSQPPNATSSNLAEPVRSESWSEWAWSWLPTWMDREGGVEEATIPSTPIPVFFAVFLDHVSLVLKVLETESGGRKRARGVLEVFAEHVAARAASCAPISLRVRFGVRVIRLVTRGRCVCGHLDPEQTPNDVTVFMEKKDAVADIQEWSWPAEILEDKVDAAEVAEEEDNLPNRGEFQIPRTNPEADQAEFSEERNEDHPPTTEIKDDNLWHVMSPIIFLDFSHTRSPPSSVSNPYDNPPVDFEFSDWGEDNSLKISVQPLQIRVTTGLLHRLSAFQATFKDLPQIPLPDIPMKTLTVEECEALYENLPLRRIDVNVYGLRIRLYPWDPFYSDTELVLDVEVPHVRLGVSGPLYSHRVCSAACQMPKDEGPLWQGARLHVSCSLTPVEAWLVTPSAAPPAAAAPNSTLTATLGTNPTEPLASSPAESDSLKTTLTDAPPGATPDAASGAAPGSQAHPLLRFDLRLMFHMLLHPEMFARRDTVHTSYTIKIHEVVACGSAPRLWAAWLVLRSLITHRVSAPLRCSQLAADALADQDYVSIDATAMDLSMRGFLTRHTQTHSLMLHSARVMAFYGPVENKLKQAWIFSAPDVPTSTSFLRVAGQFYGERFDDSLDYVGIWMEPISICIDPLLIAWLAYRPQIRPIFDPTPEKNASLLSMRRRSVQPSSSGRGISRPGSGADMVHTVRPRSASSSEPGERLPNACQLSSQPSWSILQPEQLLKLYERMQRVLLTVEAGLVLVYVCTSTASAVDCASLHDVMERHAAVFSHVMAMRMGRLTLCSSDGMRNLWDEVRHDGPTFIKVGKAETMEKALRSFPWKMSIVDVSCYTVGARQIIDSGRERAFGLQSRLKKTDTVALRTILESVTTTVTLSVVTKSMHIRSWSRPQGQASKTAGISTDEKKLKYFATGAEFKPGSLKDFVRGPARREKQTGTQPEPKNKKHELTEVTKEGPVVSIGVNLYADTPPIVVKLDQDQVNTVAATIHCLKHLEMIIRRAPQKFPRPTSTTGNRSIVRSVNEVTQDGTHSNPSFSESRSDLVPIFECYVQPEVKLKKFFWFQWVIGRATLVISSNKTKLAFEADDIISTIDLQEHYNQLKVKIGSAKIRHQKKNLEDEWTTGLLGGRVLEAREPTNAKEENQFLSVTITQAQISTLPESWKEELHPKLLEHSPGVDSLWEVFATLAPLEAVLQPAVLENIMILIQEMAPPSFCPLQIERAESRSAFLWPFCYISAGGLRLLITTEASEEFVYDTFVVVVGRVSVNPHPENPICRQSITGGLEGSWPAAGGLGGRQFEITIFDFAVQSTLIDLIVEQEAIEMSRLNGAGSENPAVKWTQPPVFSVVTPILHPVNVCCVLAPATYSGETLEGGPAMELNILTDCALELSLEQLQLAAVVAEHARAAASSSYESDVSLHQDNSHGMCPYMARVIKQTQGPAIDMDCTTTKLNEEEAGHLGSGHTSVADSGVDMSTTKQRLAFDMPSKKYVSIAFNEESIEASDYIEVFVTMGTIELSLYVGDDGSPEIMALRPPGHKQGSQELLIKSEDMLHLKLREPVQAELKRNVSEQTRSRSLTEAVRDADLAHTKLKLNAILNCKRFENNLPLLHISVHQPNLYYWKKSSIRSLQVSLFDAWVGLGAAPTQEYWSKVIFSTAKGEPDPVTDIPPALATATLKIVLPSNGENRGANFLSTSCTNTRGSLTVNIERPVLLEVSTDILQRLLHITQLFGSKLRVTLRSDTSETIKTPLLYTIRNMMVERYLESITIQVSQLGISSSEGTVGWDSASLQVAVGLRPERLVARALISALLVAAGPPGAPRHVFLQPLMIGLELESFWEAWRRVEGGALAQEPTVAVGIDLDRVNIDARPSDLEALNRIHQEVDVILKFQRPPQSRTPPAPAAPLDGIESYSAVSSELDDQLYKDDLKSGAFKLINGDQLPMTYQVILNANTVSWRYPQPRTITKIMVFPIPGVDEEVKCVLEFYHFLLSRWEPHTYLELPVLEPREIKLYVTPPDAIFAVLWRFRAYANEENKEPPFEFNIQKFSPRADPLTQVIDRKKEPALVEARGASAEELAGALRVDSYFAPRLLPRVLAVLRLTQFELHVYNSLPRLSSQASELEGYYVSPPLLRWHRMLSVLASDASLHAMLGSTAGSLLLLDAALSCDVLECATGMLEQAAAATQVRVALSAAAQQMPRARVSCDAVHVALHVSRLRTLNALANDWIPVLKKFQCYPKNMMDEQRTVPSVNYSSKRSLAYATAAVLDGRVSLWVHNSCSSELRVGQEGTDELVPLAPGSRLAYRWRSPNAPLNLRFALAGPSPDYHWSKGIPFTGGTYCVRLEDAELLGSTQKPGGGVFLHTLVDAGPPRKLTLAGRLVLANVLRRPLMYKVRARCAEAKAWRSVFSGELEPETVGRSVLCGADCDIVLKIKFGAQESGWSGDIPLKECPKENVPWLVKVPEKGEIAYVSVWCRVVRARLDNRLLAAIWPLYMLHSHLPLDTDVLVATQTELSTVNIAADTARPAPLVQASPGRGACTHLLAPGTTAARHQLSFQYRELECPVTREAIPLHYGVTDTSVFDKRAPVDKIQEVIEDIRAWLERSRQDATSGWPYSTVKSHWNAEWGPAASQPRCDVTVRYGAVRAGGGCSLLIQLCPVVLLCNAAPMPLTLRAHDAAPLCKLDQGTAICAPSAVLKKPFFLSTEVARDTFVSNQLQVWAEEPGLYGAPPPGCVGLDRSAPFAINCHQQVAFLTLYYEIKEEINILGVTSSYVLINRLNTDLLASTIAVPLETNIPTMLRPKSFKLVRPTKGGSIAGEPLCRFVLAGRWHSGEPCELGAFLCLALPAEEGTPHAPTPVRLGAAPTRRALNLIYEGTSMPVVVLQQKYESRWLVTVAPDPCPQFVVHNHTGLRLAVAEVRARHDPAASLSSALPSHMPQTAEECLGAHWWYEVDAGAVGHYSTPSYCARFPPAGATHPQVGTPVLTFGEVAGSDVEPEWSAGVAADSGEQLLQLPSGDTIKLRVRVHPHSSLLELQKVAQNDISASDIRRRLQGTFSSQESFFRPKASSDLTIKTTFAEITDVWSQSRAVLHDPRKINCDDIFLDQQKVKITGADNANALSQNVELAPEPSEPEQNTDDANLLKEKRTVELESAMEPEPTVAPESTVEAPSKVFILRGSSSMQSVHTRVVKTRSEENTAGRSSIPMTVLDRGLPACSFPDVIDSEWTSNDTRLLTERLRCVIGVIAIEMGVTSDTSPLFALHVDRAAVLIQHDSKGTKTVLSIADVQMDNLQFSSGQFDFGVVASTRAAPLAREAPPPIWSAFAARAAFGTRHASARLLLRLRHDSWRVVDQTFNELTEVELSVGPLALYVEDSYVAALTQLARAAQPVAAPPAPAALVVADTRALQCPLRLRLLDVHPLDLTLTLHTAVRMYIALDQSPLRLSSFQLRDMMTSTERLTHALTVHYLSAAILGAGWVVGGLELLGAPGALAARVGGATGGVRGVATATAAALLRSLSAWAGSLARNLDLLAGDEEHARRAAAARRRAPHSLVEGLAAGITNFAINILGAVGGLAHHPLVGVAVGESTGGAAALRRCLLGALAKPLSATADLVAFAGTGLLHQTGWDPVPQPRAAVEASEASAGAGASWRRDSVRWAFRLVELTALAGFDVLLDGAPLRLLLSHKYLVVADAESERIVEMIDLRFCSLGPYQGVIIELIVAQSQPKQKVSEAKAVDEDEEYQVNAAAMARVARYTGADGAAPAAGEARVLSLLPPPRHAAALHAALCAAVHNNADTHHHLL